MAATFRCTGATSSRLYFSATGLPSNLMTQTVTAANISAGSASVTRQGGGSSWSGSVGGLEPETSYALTLEYTYFDSSATPPGYVTETASAWGTTARETFSWDTAKTAGAAFALTAAEWNRFWTFLEARLGRSISHTAATAGGRLTAAMYNEAVTALGTGTTVTRGGTITAALLNELRDNVNNL